MRRSAEFRRRSAAAKKGWRTRRRPTLLVVLGYKSHENGFTLTVTIRPRKKLSDANVVALVELLIRKGHFDESENSTASDLRWTAGLINFSSVSKADRQIRPGRAYLEDFSRE